MNRTLHIIFAAASAALLNGARAELPRLDPVIDQPAPGILTNANFDQKLGAAVPMNLVFTNSEGAAVTLAEVAAGRPAILVLAYYGCPMLCTYVLNAVGETVDQLPFDLGKDYEVIAVSFDAREKPELAAEKKATYVQRYGLKHAGQNWHFLVGGEDAIRELTDAVGFHFAYDEAADQFAHSSGIMVLTGDGKLSHYFYGVIYPHTDVRLALVEASKNRIGSAVDRLVLYCYHYDPVSGKYTAAVMNLVRAGCLAGMLALGLFLVISFRREARAFRPLPSAGPGH